MSDPIPVPAASPKPRGRPRKAPLEPTPTVVLTPEEKRRMEWETYSRQSEAWQAQQPAPCPACGQVVGYNPVTGVQVRQYAGRVRIDGHRDACPLKNKDAVKLTR